MAKQIVFLLLLAVPLFAADLSPEAFKKAETTYREVFGAEHDKTVSSKKPAEKSAFAEKLCERAKETANDVVLQELLRKNALSFAQNDALGVSKVTDICKLQLTTPEKKIAALEKLAETTEKSLSFEPITNRLKVVNEVVMYYSELAISQESKGNAVASLASIIKAKTIVKKWIPAAKDMLVQLEADEKKYALLAQDFVEIDQLRIAVEKVLLTKD